MHSVKSEFKILIIQPNLLKTHVNNIILTKYCSNQKLQRISPSSSCARSVADIGDHGLQLRSVVSSPDALIVGRFFSCYEVIQTGCVFCALSSSAFGTKNLSTQHLLKEYGRWRVLDISLSEKFPSFPPPVSRPECGLVVSNEF